MLRAERMPERAHVVGPSQSEVGIQGQLHVLDGPRQPWSAADFQSLPRGLAVSLVEVSPSAGLSPPADSQHVEATLSQVTPPSGCGALLRTTIGNPDRGSAIYRIHLVEGDHNYGPGILGPKQLRPRVPVPTVDRPRVLTRHFDTRVFHPLIIEIHFLIVRHPPRGVSALRDTGLERSIRYSRCWPSSE